MKRSHVVALLMVLSFIGIGDSWYLAQHAAAGTPLVCDLGAGLDGCNVVAQSPYSNIFGIPVADFGLAFYGVFFLIAAIAAFMPPRTWLHGIILVLAVASSIASVGFLYIQFVLIKAICVYCVVSAVLTFCSLPLAAILLTKHSPRPPAVLP